LELIVSVKKIDIFAIGEKTKSVKKKIFFEIRAGKVHFSLIS